MSKQTIHSAIQKLRDQGYLALEPGKGRNMHIRLTQTGRRIVQQVVLPVSCPQSWKRSTRPPHYK